LLRIKEQYSYKLVKTKDLPNTLVYESSVSAVSIEFDDLSAMNFMPMMFVGTMLARATVKDGNLRILGEERLSDAQTNKVLIQMMRLHRGQEISKNEDTVSFEDIKATLDNWLYDTDKNFRQLKSGVVNTKS